MKKIFVLCTVVVFICGIYAQSDARSEKLAKLNSYKLRIMNEIKVKSDSLKLINALIDEQGGRELLGHIGSSKEISVKAKTSGFIKRDKQPFSAVLAEFKKGDEMTMLGWEDGKLLVRKNGITGYTLELNIDMNAEATILKNLVLKKEEDRNKAEEDKLKKIDEEKKQNEDQARRKRLLAKYGKDTGEKIISGYYWIGMTGEMAEDSLGEPDTKSRSAGSAGTQEQWFYSRSNVYLFFENGILKKYQK